MSDMVHPVQGSPVATYLHDDPDFVRNERLDAEDVRGN
jgi:hypothetical protein